MNILEARRRMLGAGMYKKTVTGNPAVAQGSLSRRYPGITMQGWTEQARYEGKNLFDKSRMSDGISSRIEYIPIQVGDGFFTCSSDIPPVAAGNTNLFFLAGNVLTGASSANNGVHAGVSRTVQSSNGYVTVAHREETTGNLNDPKNYNIQVEAGSTATTYEPYTGGAPSPSPDYPQEIVSAGEYDEETQKYQYEVQVTGANLFDISKVNTLNGIVNNGDGSITVNTPSGSSAISTNKTLRDLCHGITPGTYFLQADSTGQHQYIYIDRIWNFGTSTELTDEDLDKYVLLYVSGVNTTGTISNIMINHGSTALPYEPYRTPQTVTITSDRPLTKWDKLTKKDGVWGWVYNSEEVILDGTETYYVVNESYIGEKTSDAYCLEDSLMNSSLTQESFCKQLSWISMIWSPTFDGYTGYCVNDNQIHVRFSNDLIEVTKGSSITEVRDAIKQHIATMYAEQKPYSFLLKTSYETFVPLSEAEQAALNALHTNRPITVLSNNQDCEMTLTYKTKKSLEVTA